MAHTSDKSSRLAVVVGCTGFVGGYVTKALLERGFSVRGACRSPEAASAWCNKTTLAGSACASSLELVQFSIPQDGTAVEDSVMDDLVKGATAVFMCVGHEKQEPATIDFMVNAALSVLKAAKRSMMSGQEKMTVVLTSSTGSTNPPPGANLGEVKNETDFWSDPEQQRAAGKFSPAAKTLMELRSLEFVGRNPANVVVDPEVASSSPRLCIINPSLILAPPLEPGPVKGNGLPWFARIVRGEAMAKEVPNDSMSIIHCYDLAMLHVACLEHEEASGRYFGVVQSWRWEEILAAVKGIRPEYSVPAKNFTEANPVTKFDNSRRDDLLYSAFGSQYRMKSLEEILRDTIEYLKNSGHL